MEKKGYSPSPACLPSSEGIFTLLALILPCRRFASSLFTSGIGRGDIAAIVLHGNGWITRCFTTL